MLCLRTGFMMSDMTVNDSHINLKRDIFKRTVLVLILSSIIISNMEANIRIGADLWMVKTHVAIKIDEYNAVMFGYVLWKSESFAKQYAFKQIHFSITVYYWFRYRKLKRSVQMHICVYVDRHRHKCSLYQISVSICY